MTRKGSVSPLPIADTKLAASSTRKVPGRRIADTASYSHLCRAWPETFRSARSSFTAMGDLIEFASNGSTCTGYLATPAGGSGPGVVVIQEWWGLVDHVKDVCDRFAGEGFVALAPDLYHGAKTTEPDEAAKAMMALRLDRAAKDMGGAVEAVAARSRGTGVGVVGFCMGGGLALMLASQRPDKVRAVVAFYGVVPWDGAQPDYPGADRAVLGHYRARTSRRTPRRPWPWPKRYGMPETPT